MVVPRKKIKLTWSFLLLGLVSIFVGAVAALLCTNVSWAGISLLKALKPEVIGNGKLGSMPERIKPAADYTFGLNWWYTGVVSNGAASYSEVKEASPHHTPLDSEQNLASGQTVELPTRPSAPLMEVLPPPFEGMRYGRPSVTQGDTEDGEQGAIRSKIEKATSGTNNSKVHPLKTQVICWNGPAMPWPTNRERKRLAQGGIHVEISGEGCASCIAGLTCEFLLFILGDGDALGGTLWQEEISVMLTGPSILRAELVEHRRAESRNGVAYSVTYSAWDPGRYKVEVRSDCYPSSSTTRSRPLAQFGLQILSMPRELVRRNPIRPTTPCDMDVLGRWLLVSLDDGRETAMFAPHNCLGDFFPVTSILEELVLKNMMEISFVGGAQHLLLFLHLQSLLSGGKISTGIQEGEDISWAHPVPGTSSPIRLNFYWLDNIVRDNEYGCAGKPYYTSMEGKFRISSKSKMIILEVTSWTFEHCNAPELAYSKYLPWFFDNFVWWYTSSKTVAHVFWRSAPPFPSPTLGCQRSRNRRLQWANDLARTLTHRHGFSYLDFWPIEGPVYDDACPLEHGETWGRSARFSCMHANQTSIGGPVGDAVVQVLVHRLSEYPTPLDL